MRKVLVTGSSGLVGKATVKVFEEKGWKVIGIDNDMRSELFGTPKKEPEINIDIRNGVALERLFKLHKFDAIVHTAAQPSHDWSKKEPMIDFSINAIGTLNLLEATRMYRPKAVFVNVSTDKVYGENRKRKLVGITASPSMKTYQ